MHWRPGTHPFQGRLQSVSALAGVVAFIAIAAGVLLAGSAAPTAEANSAAPTITSIELTSTPATNSTYRANETISARVTFDQTVTVSGGTPRLYMVWGNVLGNLAYVSGSGTNTLDLAHTLEPNLYSDSDGISTWLPTLSMHEGSITGANGKNADLSFTGIPTQPGHKIDTFEPGVISVSLTSKPVSHDTYGLYAVITARATFSEPVTITGEPQLALTIGNNVRTATMSSHSPRHVDFTYKVQSSDAAPDGISIAANSISLNGGTIQDNENNNAVLTYNALTAQSTQKVNGNLPVITGLQFNTRPANGHTYVAGETITIYTDFNKNITITGAPQLTLTIGSNSRNVTYTNSLNRSALFSYTVQSGDLDTNGVSIAANSLSLNGGTIEDSASNNALLSNPTLAAHPKQKVDAAAPTVSSVAVTSTPNSANTYGAAEVITVRATFSENFTLTGNPQLALTIGTNTPNATYSTHTDSTIDFTYTVQSNDKDTDGISIAANSLSANGGSIRDAVGNNATLAHTAIAAASTQKVNGSAPSISATSFPTAPANGNTFIAGDTITARVTFNENITVTGSPQLTLTIGANSRTATYNTSSGANIDFTYTAQAGDNDSDGIAIAADSLSLNAGTIQDSDGNNAFLTHAALAANSNRKVDTIAPTITATGWYSTAPDNDTYVVGNTFAASVTFSELLTVTGTPNLNVTIGDNTRAVPYSVEGGETMYFYYTVQSGDNDADGIAIPANALSLNGGTIKDRSGNNAVLTHAALTADAKRKVDTAGPAISSVSLTSTPNESSTYALGEVITARATFDDNATVTGAPQLSLTVGSNTRTAAYSAASGKTIDFTYTVQANDKDTDGVSIAANSLSLNGGTIRDALGNNAPLSHTALAAASTQKVNGKAPIVTAISWVTSPANGNHFGPGEKITARVTFNKGVHVSGSGAELDITIGSNTRTADYSTNSGPNVDFSYTVRSGDSDSDGISIAANSLSMSGNNIVDPVGDNNAFLAHHALAADSNRKVDTTAPTVTGITWYTSPSDDQTYVVGDYILATVFFSEPVAITGTPQLDFTIGANTRKADHYPIGKGAQSEQFGYTIQSGDNDSDGISIPANALSLNGGTIKDPYGNNAVLTLSGLTDDSERKVDALGPTVTSVAIASTPTSDDTYGLGQVITARVTFNEDIAVTGTPELTLTIGSNSRTATYSAGNSTHADFTYTVQASDRDTDGISIAANSLDASSGTIKDNYGNWADLSHSALVAQAAHKVSGPTIPTGVSISSSTPTGKSYYPLASTITFRANFSANLSGDVANLSLPVQMDSGEVVAAYSSHSNHQVFFTHTVGSNDWDFDGLTIDANALRLSSGSITDSTNASVSLNNPGYASHAYGKVRDDFLGKALRITSHNGGCLDVQYGRANDGQTLWTFDCNGTNAQKWLLGHRNAGDQEDKYFMVSKAQSMLHCLDNTGNLTNGGKTHLWTCLSDTHGAVANQSFDFELVSGNQYRIVFQKGNTKTYLAADGALSSRPKATQSTTANANTVWTIEVHP